MTLLYTGISIVLGLILIWMSKNQPFPEHSQKFGFLLIVLGSLGFIAEQAEREVGPTVEPLILTILGGLGVVIGLIHAIRTRMDVLIAPFSGFLLVVGTISLFSNEWSSLSNFEQISAFVLISLIILLNIYLVFRTLLIGKLPLAWSQSGLRQLRRGVIFGDRGAISCFEKAWDVDEEHLNAMAYSALSLIHQHFENEEEYKKWNHRLLELGGFESVDDTWISAVKDGLNKLSND
jgi:hypothetical protein|tara:strand:- start:4942 stop:5646 length:705 start_codon:yes stop_codon:yes gene_type:complete